jgi:hypothetical protein
MRLSHPHTKNVKPSINTCIEYHLFILDIFPSRINVWSLHDHITSIVIRLEKFMIYFETGLLTINVRQRTIYGRGFLCVLFFKSFLLDFSDCFKMIFKMCNPSWYWVWSIRPFRSIDRFNRPFRSNRPKSSIKSVYYFWSIDRTQYQLGSAVHKKRTVSRKKI